MPSIIAPRARVSRVTFMVVQFVRVCVKLLYAAPRMMGWLEPIQSPGKRSFKMSTIAEPARSVEVVLETEVLVVGSGPGGLAAALAAARAGARTALIDRNGCFGGNITQVGGEGFAWDPYDALVVWYGLCL